MADTNKIALAQALNWALDDAMAEDDKILVLGEDIGDGEGGGVAGITNGLSTKYGWARVRSTPIAEQSIMGAAVGAAIVGYKVVAEIMLMNFTTVAMDMIVNHAAKLRFMSGGQTHVPIVITTMTGSGFALGGQHSDYLESWFAHVPGMKVVAPSNPADGYGLMLSSLDDPDPVLFIENINLLGVPGPAPERGKRIPLGKANIVHEGRDVTIVTHSRMVIEAVNAAKKLAADGITAEVIDLRTISPWDRQAVLASAEKTGRVVVVHEAVQEFGIGGEIASVITEKLFKSLKAPVKRIGGAYSPVPFSQPLEAAFAPNAAKIEAEVRSLVSQ